MTPLELIEYGVQNSDWQSVIEAYKLLTGKTLFQFYSGAPSGHYLQNETPIVYPSDFRPVEDSIPIPPSNFAFVPPMVLGTSIAEMRELQGLPELRSDPPVSLEEFNAPPRNFTTTTKKDDTTVDGKKKPKTSNIEIGPRPNTFFDDRTLAVGDLKENNPGLEKAYPKELTERREGVKKVKVICESCKKEEMVHPIFAPISLTLDGERVTSTYRCNKCLSGQVYAR